MTNLTGLLNPDFCPLLEDLYQHTMSSSAEESALMVKVYAFEYLIVSEICHATALSKVCDGPL